MKLKTFCSLTMIPTLILILLLLTSLDNYSIQTDTYGQPIYSAPIYQSSSFTVLSSYSYINSTTADNGTASE
ncbi:hypothetical protein NMY3_02917 [Candidatus Nitrosocosmicus oleophilus]|uniref:Uncharacterized protein n=1 Tax=Candidatus Nitrosocosmicus oleophilus TaxID=1353260 RepID=A0A654M3A3_9ARCH|nr:hypothetical protein NMY3_02917 [Candidatus Nitrosocosmicus oleophilus]